MHTTPATATRPTTRRCSGVIHFPGGFAWPARDHRVGRFVVCHHGQPFLTLAVCDDFGTLQPVPSWSLADGGTVKPAADFAEGQH